jgi:hypothetical protein
VSGHGKTPDLFQEWNVSKRTENNFTMKKGPPFSGRAPDLIFIIHCYEK